MSHLLITEVDIFIIWADRSDKKTRKKA